MAISTQSIPCSARDGAGVGCAESVAMGVHFYQFGARAAVS
ncbi:hypothetical protein ROS217_16386 [Roseovarius sp. 217]|nr:hypothetical protein ROS217_16386 [Roseovarius sp. 217]